MRWRRKNSLVALTCLLDLLFVMVFVALALEDVPDNPASDKGNSSIIENTRQIEKLHVELKLRELEKRERLIKQLQKQLQAAKQSDLSSDNDMKLLGVWLQNVEVRGHWRAIGQFVVFKNQTGALRMAAVAQAANLQYTKGISEVQLSGSEWTFKSDWSREGIAEFRLKRVREGVYEGASYLRGKFREKNRWTRLE